MSGVDGRRYQSLEDALRAHRVPLENHRFIAELMAGLDLEGYSATSSYIKAVRADGGPALQITSGYTNGFRSEDEIVSRVGDVDRWPSGRGSGLWGVSHPVHSLRSTGDAAGGRHRAAALCPACGSVMPLSGVCDICA